MRNKPQKRAILSRLLKICENDILKLEEVFDSFNDVLNNKDIQYSSSDLLNELVQQKNFIKDLIEDINETK